MCSEQQIYEPNQIQLIVGALIQAIQIAQQITDENIKTVLLNTTHHQPPIRMPIFEENPGTYDNIYEIISQFLKIAPQQLKESIHRSLIVEDPEVDSKITLKLEKGKVNKLILNTICEKYQIRLLIFNGKTKLKKIYGNQKDFYFWNLSNQKLIFCINKKGKK